MTSTTNAPPIVSTIAQTAPTSTVEITCPSDSIPSGFVNRSAPPGAGTPIATGFSRNPVAVRAVATMPSVKAGRHLGEGNVPVGNKNSMNASDGAVMTKTHSATVPTTSGIGSEPGCVAIPTTAYADAMDSIARPRPTPWSSQPMTFRARRTISAPQRRVQDTGDSELGVRERIRAYEVAPRHQRQDHAGDPDRRRCDPERRGHPVGTLVRRSHGPHLHPPDACGPGCLPATAGSWRHPAPPSNGVWHRAGMDCC